MRDVGVEQREGQLGGVEAEQDAVLLLGDARPRPGAGRDGRLRRDVARADVLGEGLAHDRFELGARGAGHGHDGTVASDATRRLAAGPHGAQPPPPRGRSADPQALWRAAAALRLSETRTLGRLVRWRIPGVPPDQTFQGLFADYPFSVLDEGDGWMLSGLAGRIWTLQRDYPRLDGPEAFRDVGRAGHRARPVRPLGRARRRRQRDLSPRPASRPSTAAPGCACARCGRSSARSSA